MKYKNIAVVKVQEGKVLYSQDYKDEDYWTIASSIIDSQRYSEKEVVP